MHKCYEIWEHGTQPLRSYSQCAEPHFAAVKPDRWMFFDYGQAVEMLKGDRVYGFASDRSAMTKREWTREARK